MPDTPLKILLIEDNPGDARLVREMLADGTHDVALEWVSSLSQGLECLDQGEIDLVLLDLALPDSHGLDTFLKAYTHTPGIPFVLLTGLDDETLALTAVQKGAQDYLIKGKTNGGTLFKAVRYATERKKRQEALRRAKEELERRVEERTAELVAANQQLQEEIARRQQAEAARQGLLETLEGEWARLRAIIDCAPEAIVVADAQARVILANKMADSLYGQPAPRGKDFSSHAEIHLCYPDGTPYDPRQLPLIRAALDGETQRNVVMGIRWPDGTWRDLLVNAGPIKSSRGEITGAVGVFQDITGLKETEREQQRLLKAVQISTQQLQLSNEALSVQAEELEDLTGKLAAERNLLRSVLEQMPAGVIIAEAPSGRIILSNRRAENIFQQPGSLTDLEKFRQIPRFYPNGRPCPSDDFPIGRALTLGETVVDEEYLLQRDAGDHLQTVHINVNATPVRNQHGSIIAAVATHSDITAWKQAQAALLQSEERYRSLVELSPDAIVVHIRGKIVFVNHAAVKLFGAASPDDLLGFALLDRIHPDYHKLSRECVRKIRAGAKVNPQEEKILRLDGEVVEVEIIGSAIIYQGRRAVQVVLRDITERKKAREALRAANAKLQTLIEASPLAIVHLDREGQIQSCNRVTESMFGWWPDELRGRSLPIAHEEKREEAQNLIQRAFKGELLTGLEVRGHRKDGALIDVSISVAPMYAENGEVTGIVALAEDITARKQAEAALAKSRAEFEAIFNSISDAIIFADSQRHIILANPAVKSMFGYEPEELIGRSTEVLYANRTDFEATREKYYERVEPDLFEMAYRRKDGSLFSAESLASQVKDAQGNILGGIGIHRDITARKKAEEGLEQERQRLFALLDSLPGIVLLHGPDYSIRFANRRFWEAFGDPGNHFCYEIFQKLQTPCEGCPLPKVIETQTPHEWEQITEGGRTFQMYKYPFCDTDGTSCVLSLGLDTTDRKLAEEALRESEEKFRQLAENIDDVFWLGSPDWQKTYYVSPAYEKVWGRSCDSLYKQPSFWLESVVPEDRDKVRAAFEQRSAEDLLVGFFPEYRIIRADGAVRWILARFFPIYNEAGEIYRIAGIASDITSRKEAEAVLQWREEHLRQTAKMEAVGRLAGGVAHDFNNLLTVISGYGELMLADLKESDQGHRHVQAILNAAHQATAVTRQLLAFSRKQVMQPQTIDLNDLITGLVELVSRLVDEDINVSMNLEPGLGAVKADPSQIEQVIMNLAINAMDAMPNGGTLTIETANIRIDPDHVQRYQAIDPGAYVVVTVQDNGIGMKRQVLSHIFEPFFTTKERDKGTGLGLSMAYGIIRQSGGYILVESAPGRGSMFRIYLPRVPKTGKSDESLTPARVNELDKATILLVEDEEGVRHVVKHMLGLRGFSVLTARDGHEALKIGKNHSGPIHLLLTDVAMPVMGGRELAESLTLVHPEMRVLFMSGHTEDGMVRRGIRESVINFIQKPFRAKQLLSKIRELLAEPKP